MAATRQKEMNASMALEATSTRAATLATGGLEDSANFIIPIAT